MPVSDLSPYIMIVELLFLIVLIALTIVTVAHYIIIINIHSD